VGSSKEPPVRRWRFFLRAAKRPPPETTRRALSEPVRVDEVKQIHDLAELISNATDIRPRAERRAYEILIGMKAPTIPLRNLPLLVRLGRYIRFPSRNPAHVFD
jgi:hypothetical protein